MRLLALVHCLLLVLVHCLLVHCLLVHCLLLALVRYLSVFDSNIVVVVYSTLWQLWKGCFNCGGAVSPSRFYGGRFSRLSVSKGSIDSPSGDILHQSIYNLRRLSQPFG